jgi:hypothetical protein
MARFKPGDKIDCLVKEGVIMKLDDYDTILTFEVLAIGEYGYYVFVPQYYSIKNTVIINPARCTRYGISLRFLWEQMTHVTENLVYRLNREMDGMCCAKCGDFVLMAGPNRENGTMICYGCRSNPYR